MSFVLFEKYGVENCNIILMENVDVKSKDELTAREAEYIKNNKCINKFLPYQTNEERKEKVAVCMRNYFSSYLWLSASAAAAAAAASAAWPQWLPFSACAWS